MSDPYGGDLAAKLCQRYAADGDEITAELMQEDHVVPLVGFLFTGLERSDLRPDEVAEATELARAGRLLKSNECLLDRLIAYQRDVLHVA